jgi:acyl carrier protein
MATKNEILKIIYDCIDDNCIQNEISMEKNLDTKLFGSESELDSLGLVGLIVDIEESINSNYNISISIADEKAMSLKNSPFKNIETLSDYILELTKLKIN